MILAKNKLNPVLVKAFTKYPNFALEFRVEFWDKVEPFVGALSDIELNLFFTGVVNKVF